MSRAASPFPLVAGALLALLASCESAPERPAGPAVPRGAQLAIDGRVLTLDQTNPEGTGLVIDRGLVTLVAGGEGATEIPGTWTPRLRVPPGGVAMPGIIESHAHLLAVGRARRALDLRGAATPEAAAELVRARAGAVPAGSWILGRGWDHERWPERRFPDRSLLDAAAPGHPVLLFRVDGHAAWANGRALEAAGIAKGTPDPPGGEILRDAAGEPTGVLVDAAADLAQAAVPKAADQETVAEDYLAAQAEALALGITTFVDAGATDLDLLQLANLYAGGRMKMRTYAMLAVDSQADLDHVMARRPVPSLHEDRLAVRALKIYADGALGSRGAWLLEPYADRPGHFGLKVKDPGFIEQAARRALERGYQVCVHAIGDRANREVLDAFERATAGPAPLRTDHRFRIEHAQVIDPADVPRFRALGVIPSMQTCHATSDGPWVEARLGAGRLDRAYPWQRLLLAGSVIANGTDAPVESLNPFENLYAACVRGRPDGSFAFTPAERMNRLEALYSLTVWGAHAIFAEDRRGMLRPGMQADVVVLDRNPLTCPVEELPRVRVLATVVAGEVVHLADPALLSGATAPETAPEDAAAGQ